MSFWDNMKKFAQPYADDDYDDYDEEEDYLDYDEPAEAPRRPSRRAVAPAAPAAPAPAVEEDEDDPILCAIEDENELETVYGLIMEQLYDEETEEL